MGGWNRNECQWIIEVRSSELHVSDEVANDPQSTEVEEQVPMEEGLSGGYKRFAAFFVLSKEKMNEAEGCRREMAMALRRETQLELNWSA